MSTTFLGVTIPQVEHTSLNTFVKARYLFPAYGSFSLPVPPYQYDKPRSIPPDQRLGKLCNCEVHYLCVCRAYNNLQEDPYAVIY